MLAIGCFIALLAIPHPSWIPDVWPAVESMSFSDSMLLIAGVATAGVLGIHLISRSQYPSGSQPDEPHSEALLNAVAMLDSPRPAVRSAGIFAMRELAIASPDTNYIPVLDILCLFIREKLALPLATQDKETALDAISDIRNTTENSMKIEEVRGWTGDLREADLRGISISDTNLSNMLLSESDFSGACLWRVDLSGTWLLGAKLDDAELHGANLSAARLIETSLTNADLQGVVLDDLTKLEDVWAYAETGPHNSPRQLKKRIKFRNRK